MRTVVILIAALAVLVAARANAQTTTTTTYAYDTAGRLVEVRSPGETTRYHYDAAGNLTAETVEAAPYITAVNPDGASAGSAGLTLVVDGINFSPTSVVQWNGSARPTAFVSASRVTATITAADLAATSSVAVTVTSPGPPAATSAARTFFVTPSGADVTAGASVRATVSTGATTVSVTLAGVTANGSITGAATAPGDAPAGLTFVPSATFELSVAQLSFSNATICVPYTDADLQALGFDEQLLVLLHQEPGTSGWTDITTSRDSAGNTVCGQTASFSPFALAAVRPGSGTNVRYLAEGSTSTFFDTQIALANPDALTPANATLRFLKADGLLSARYVALPPLSRRTVTVKAVAGMAVAAFSTVVESDAPVVVDRTMSWDATGYGSHAEGSAGAPSPVWYLAEGATHSGFNLFYLVQNPNADPVEVEVTYLRPSPAAPLVKTYAVPGNTRFNIWVDVEQFPAGSGNTALSNTDVSAVLRSADPAKPIIVERAMYLDANGQLFGAGHDSAGVTAPSEQWFLAEGATGPSFDLFVLVANPTDLDAQIEARYLLTDGTVHTKAYTVAANSRYNIWVNLEQIPEGSGQRPLANVAVSTAITSTNGVPVIVERSMWWPKPTGWYEAHNSPGSTTTGTVWGLAEGAVGGNPISDTYILIANTSGFAGTARVTLLFEDGGTAVRDTNCRPTAGRTCGWPQKSQPQRAGGSAPWLRAWEMSPRRLSSSERCTRACQERPGPRVPTRWRRDCGERVHGRPRGLGDPRGPEAGDCIQPCGDSSAVGSSTHGPQATG